MKKTKDWNNVSPKTLAALKLNKSKAITIKMAGIRYNDDGSVSVPRSNKMPTTDRIIDPANGEAVSIGLISAFSSNGTPKIDPLYFVSGDGGYKTFNPKSVKDKEILEFLLLSDFNGSKEGRDTEKKVWWTVYEPEKIAEDAYKEDVAKADAVLLIGAMDNAAVKGFAAAKGWSEKDVRVLRRKMAVWANSDHKGFMAFADDKTMRINSVLRKAELEGLLAFDNIANEWQWKSSGETIKGFSRSKNFDRYAAYKEWMLESDTAVKILDDLEVELGMAAPKKLTPKAPAKPAAKK